MKANKTIKCLKNDKSAYVQVVASIVALLVAIIIGVMVYFEVSTGVDQFDEVIETFTIAQSGNNSSAWSVTLLNSPAGASNTNVTCYNSSGNSDSWPTFGLNHETINVAADAADEFQEVNVTYTGNIASQEATTTTMAGTVFGLLPIIALVVVAAIIIGIILVFGKGGKKGGI